MLLYCVLLLVVLHTFGGMDLHNYVHTVHTTMKVSDPAQNWNTYREYYVLRRALQRTVKYIHKRNPEF
jgi:hypothetical protein